MRHQVGRSLEERLLFRTWREARWLWDDLVGAAPDSLRALVLMPDHFHLIHPLDVRRRVAAALGAFARRRNAARGERGPVFDALPEPRLLADAQKVRLNVRYVHLNPCRANLTRDPLVWPFSTHRDACGLALPAVVAQAHEVAKFHKVVSSDPSAVVGGTALPREKREVDSPVAVLHAVSALTRTPLADLTVRGPARTLFVGAALALCPSATRRRVGELAEMDERSVYRTTVDASAVKLVAQVVADSAVRGTRRRAVAVARDPSPDRCPLGR